MQSAPERTQSPASDLRRTGLSSHPITRAAFASFLAKCRPNTGQSHNDIALELWPKDMITQRVLLRGAIDPQFTDDHPGLAQNSVSSFFAALPLSAGARLIDAGLKPDIKRRDSATALPFRANQPSIVPWVGEGDPIPVRSGAVGTLMLGPTKKAALIMGFSRELANIANAEAVFRQLLLEDAALTVDAAIFDTAAGDDDRPAGLLNGVTPIAGYSGGDDVAMLADLKALAAAVAAGGGSGQLALIVSPARFNTLQLILPDLAWPVWPSLAVPADRMIGLDPTAFASTIGDGIHIDVTNSATLHMSTIPGQIVDGTASDPVRSLWQTDSIAMRMMVWLAYGMRGDGLVQYVEGATW